MNTDNTYRQAAKIEIDSYDGLQDAYQQLKAENDILKQQNKELLEALKEIHQAEAWSRGETIVMAGKALEKYSK